MKKITTGQVITLLLLLSIIPVAHATVMVTNSGNTDITLLAYYTPDTPGKMLPGNPLISMPLAKGQSAQIDFKHAPLGTLSAIGVEGQEISRGTWMAVEEIVKNPKDGDQYTFTQRWVASAVPNENRETITK